MLIFSNTICFKTIGAFADQVKWLCLMGPFLCLMAICMFAAIRCPFEKDEEDKKTQPYEQPGGANTQFQNVDKNAANNFNSPPNDQQQTKQHGLDI